jgi:hypothetical protein
MYLTRSQISKRWNVTTQCVIDRLKKERIKPSLRAGDNTSSAFLYEIDKIIDVEEKMGWKHES